MDRLRRIAPGAAAIHPVLAPASLGLLALGTGLDVLAAGHDGPLSWLGFWCIAAGVATGTWCAGFALLDWVLFARLGEAGVFGLDGFATAIVVGLYALDALLRVDGPFRAASPAAMALEVAGAALLAMKTWIGRELAAWLDEHR
jgi:uncharacterized membrane protein